jgi:hypothetical protein
MSRRSLLCGAALATVAILRPLPARAAADAEAMLRAADASRHILQEGVIRVRALVRTNDAPPVRTDLEIYLKGKDHVRYVFLEGTQKGREVLFLGTRTWLIVPGSSRPIPVSPNQRLLGGASVVDLGRLHFSDEFVATVREGEETVDGVPCRVLDLKGRSRRSTYASGVLWMGEQDLLPRRARLALSSGKPSKELSFVEFGRENGKTVLRRMEVSHLLESEAGTTTTLEFLRYEPRTLPDTLFVAARTRGPR